MLPLTSDGQNGAVAIFGREYMLYGLSGRAKERADLRCVRCSKTGVVSVRERPTTGNDLTVGVVTDSLELPHAANQFEITDVLARSCVHAVDPSVDCAKNEGGFDDQIGAR